VPVVSFIVAGFMKSGTTTINDYLLLNDDVAMCNPKEPQFFSRNYGKGITYYESLWTSTNDKICGEASTCYSRWPFYTDVPKRIALYNPNMKLIFIMRHPVERAYSHYKHNILVDRCSYLTFSEALEFSNEILMSSMYMQQLNRFLEYFPKEQILLLDFDELIKGGIAAKTWEDFIGAKAAQKDTLTKKIVSNPAGFVASKADVIHTLSRVRNNILIKTVTNRMFTPIVRRKIRKKIEQYLDKSFLIRKLSLMKVKKIKCLSQGEREKLLNQLRLDTEELEKFWGKDLSKWKI